MTVAAEQAAPGWVPLVALLVPIAIMVAVLVPALRRRARYKEVRRSGVTAQPRLDAMAVRPEDHGPTADGLPHDEGWAGTMLGLKSRISSSTSVLEPHVYWGTRDERQVFVRIGPDERIEGGTTMFSNRHIRAITVLRVDGPAFTWRPEEGVPPALAEALEDVDVNAIEWRGLFVAGGPHGLVATRSAIDGVENAWVHDLWLCEHIADAYGLEPLPPKRIGPAWKVPYGLGRSLTPAQQET
jgi:hypothetical protein